MLTKFRPLAIRFLDYYVIAVVFLCVIWIVVAVIEGLGDAKATAGDKIFSVLFGVLAPAVAFAVSRGVKAEFKKAAERKRPERCLVRFDKYCWGTCGLAFTIFAILAWFNPEEPTVLDKAFSSLMCAVYGPAMAFVGCEPPSAQGRRLPGSKADALPK